MRGFVPDWNLYGQKELRHPGSKHEHPQSLPILQSNQLERKRTISISGRLAQRCASRQQSSRQLKFRRGAAPLGTYRPLRVQCGCRVVALVENPTFEKRFDDTTPRSDQKSPRGDDNLFHTLASEHENQFLSLISFFSSHFCPLTSRYITLDYFPPKNIGHQDRNCEIAQNGCRGNVPSLPEVCRTSRNSGSGLGQEDYA